MSSFGKLSVLKNMHGKVCGVVVYDTCGILQRKVMQARVKEWSAWLLNISVLMFERLSLIEEWRIAAQSEGCSRVENPRAQDF